MNTQELITTAKKLVGDDKGSLAMNESTMNLRFKSQRPWALTFSFARALQQSALEIWRGEETNVSTAQIALVDHDVRRGEFTVAMEKA